MLVGVVTVLAAGAIPAVGSHSPGVTQRVSVDSDGNQANSMSGRRGRAALNADGRFVAFDSLASNLVQGDTNDRDDIFVHDRLTREVELVSVSTSGQQGTAQSVSPAISADGRFVAFESSASNLVADDTNGRSDVFVRDRVAGTTERVSVGAAGAEGDAASFGAAISADGRFVAFVSDASTLAPGENNFFRDVFVRDRVAGTTERVSVSSAGVEGNGFSTPPDISADGRFVTFGSFARNLVAGDTNGSLDIFVHDRAARTTERVSVDSAGAEANAASFLPAIGGDGRFVAFASDASNLVPGDTNARRDVFVRDRLTGATERASVDSAGAQANSDSAGPGFRGMAASLGVDISDDGRFVSFDSSASNLVEGDMNTCTFVTIQFTAPGTCPDIFVRDRVGHVTHRVSIDSAGAEANHGSTDPAISGDGTVAGFFSLASNLVPGDTNACQVGFVTFEAGRCPDIFVHDVSGRSFDADVSVSQSASPDPALIGRELTYTVLVTNDGPSLASRVQLTDTLPATVRFLSASASTGTCAEAGGTVTCSLGQLSAGESATVAITVRPIQLDQLTNVTTVTARQADPDASNNSSSLETTVTTH